MQSGPRGRKGAQPFKDGWAVRANGQAIEDRWWSPKEISQKGFVIEGQIERSNPTPAQMAVPLLKDSFFEGSPERQGC